MVYQLMILRFAEIVRILKFPPFKFIYNPSIVEPSTRTSKTFAKDSKTEGIKESLLHASREILEFKEKGNFFFYKGKVPRDHPDLATVRKSPEGWKI